MKWLKNLIRFGGTSVEHSENTTTIDVMRDDINPSEITIENAYKTRWVWYHIILALEILMTNFLLLAILVILAVRL
jgi:hypothetical protein|tara:strand:+ start:832 stop:1059 length:228 start_codon:yes stop_codon:yes gene_type:complete